MTTEHESKVVKPEGQHGGPTYSYRGATIHSNKQGTLFKLDIDGLPGTWNGLGNLKLPMSLVDSWLDHGRLPPHYAATA
jgi:hypothetical protein